MLEINARPFIGALTELRAVQMLIAAVQQQEAAVSGDDLVAMLQHVDHLIAAVEAVGSRSALRSAQRLQAALQLSAPTLTYAQTNSCLSDIESRFADHLDDILLLVIPDQHVSLFGDATDLMGDDEILFHFLSATFELEEAAKCLALGRPTACVFHCMRMIELGTAAFAKHLQVDDPIKANDRSWGVILNKIKDALDKDYPKKTRLPNTEGAELESIYATLDAIKGPWRNATMHVETVYTDSDAQHILNCTKVFMGKLMTRCDEDGHPYATPMGV